MCPDVESSIDLDAQLLEIIADCSLVELKHLICVMEREATRLESHPSEIP